jgi:hypothetical protein
MLAEHVQIPRYADIGSSGWISKRNALFPACHFVTQRVSNLLVRDYG